MFRHWESGLPPGIEVCAVELPGRGARFHEPPFTAIPPLLDVLVPVIRERLDVPFALFGHSMGAGICFELAHRLAQEPGVQLGHLFISAYGSPALPCSELPFYHLPHDEFIHEVCRFDGMSSAIREDKELLELILPKLRADFELIQTYRYSPRPPLRCPITALGGIDDKHVKPEELKAWNSMSTGTFHLQMLPGDHFFVQSSEAMVVKTVKERLLQTIF